MNSKPQYQSPPPQYSQGQPSHRPPPSSMDSSKDSTNTIVIITILIVVISVVLATVFYLLTFGMLRGGSTEPGVTLDDGVSTGTPGEWRVEVHSVFTSEALSGYKAGVLNDSYLEVPYTDLVDIKTGGASGDGLTLSYYDVTDDNKLNEGDYFILSGTDTTSDYQIAIYWKESGNKINGATGIIEQ